MPETNVVLEIVCGNDVDVPVQLYEGDTGTTPLDLTGVTEIVYVARKQAGAGAALIELKLTEDTIEVTGGPEDGLIKLHFADTDTLPVSGDRLVGVFAMEIQVTDASGHKTTVLQGDLKVRATVVA